MLHTFVGFRYCGSSHGRLKTVVDSTNITAPRLHFLIGNPSSVSTRFVSSTTVSSSNELFTVDYLVNSCGLSPESALKASQRLLLKAPKSKTKPDSVVSLFKSYGFTQTQISKLISSCPSLLLTKAKTLKPKLDFFVSLGIRGSLLANILNRDTNYLTLSLEKQIIPSINFFRSLGLTNDNIAVTLNRCGWLLHNVERKMGPNIAILRDHGVPESIIWEFVMMRPQHLLRDSDQYTEFVLELHKLGVDPSTTWFGRCLDVLMSTKKIRWDANMAMYMSFGWSKDEVISMFKKQPQIMSKTPERINSALDFFINRLKWNRDEVAKYPAVISYSLEKRVIPRCYVIQILVSNGLIHNPNIGAVLKTSEKIFLRKFVSNYEEKLPDLLNAYSSKISAEEVRIGSEDDHKISV